MTQTCETANLPKPTPTRPRAVSPLPVLISIPTLTTSGRATRPGPRGRRRLRREVRIVGYALLALLPISMAFVAFGAERLPTLAASLTVEPRPAAVISLEPLEPVITVHRELDAPVVLPGYLLPADTTEESSDGGH